MTATLKRIVILLSCFSSGWVLTGCFNSAPVRANGGIEQVKPNNILHKPGSSFPDTLTVTGSVAIFYSPDSAQLEKIRKVTDAQVFKGSMHEYTYQIKNAHFFLGKYWPHLKIVDVRDVRYLLFNKNDGATQLIDLDMQDPCGMFVFDGVKKPQGVDMTNIDTQMPDYFRK